MPPPPLREKARIPIDQALEHPFVSKAEEHPKCDERTSVASAGKLAVSKSEVRRLLLFGQRAHEHHRLQ